MKSIAILFTVFLLFQFSFATNSLRRKKVAPVAPGAVPGKAPIVAPVTPAVNPAAVFPPAKADVGEIWDDLFTVSRTSSCISEENKMKIEAQVQQENAQKYSTSQDILINDSSYAWIKKWGFGPVAYLMDYIDPLLRADIIAEFKSIHGDTMKEDPENTPNYKDSFDIAAKISGAGPEEQVTLMKELNQFKKGLDPVIYGLSANSVQIYKVMKSFRWFIDPGLPDYAADFITKYDINHDGRLNPRELILGSIHYNKGLIGSKKCTHCYSKIGNKIGALFTYIDCGESGFVNADQLWKTLPGLRRPSPQYNIFGYGNSENIRTNAINDFVLKNQKAKDAALTKDEFIQGVLLGVWDRQVSESGISEDDGRNLKKLRWTQNNMVDTVAYNYVKAITKARIEDEEKARAEKYENEKKAKALAEAAKNGK